MSFDCLKLLNIAVWTETTYEYFKYAKDISNEG